MGWVMVSVGWVMVSVGWVGWVGDECGCDSGSRVGCVVGDGECE